MADERKKRLEEIRRRKAEMARLLKESSSKPSSSQPAEQPKDPAVNPSAASSSSETKSEEKVVQKDFSAAKRKSRGNNFFEDPSKNIKMLEIRKKKLNETLKPVNFTTFCQGVYPELKDEAVQSEKIEEKPSEDELKLKAELLKKMPGYARRSSMSGVGKDMLKHAREVLSKMKKDTRRRYSEAEIENFYNRNKEQFEKFLNDRDSDLEEALTTNSIFDICSNYYNENEEDVDMSKRAVVNKLCELYDDQCSGRIVTSLDWSTKQPDLFLSGFSATNDYNQQSGLIELWSLNNKKEPDYTIKYQTELTSAIFYNYNPKIVMGGSFTGQILLWDIKSKPIPIQKTPLGITSTSNTHCYPIHCLTILGNEHNNTIISISSDGVMCEWSMSNLSKPISKISLKSQDIEDDRINEISPLCISTNQSLNRTLIIGSDDNNIYQIKTGEEEEDTTENVISVFKGSQGPVFSVDVHPICQENINGVGGDLFLTSGADWSAKLWTVNACERPLLNFSASGDYIYASKWHPINPSLFATADGSGKIDFWDLNKDLEMPIFTTSPGGVINKLAWSSDGKKLAAGDINGHTHIFGAEKDVCGTKDDFDKFQKVIDSIKAKAEGKNDIDDKEGKE